MRTSHDDATLHAMAREHVFYEVEKLALWSQVGIRPEIFDVAHLPRVDQAAARDEIQRIVGQATLESALVHLRNVAEFLVNDRPRESRIRMKFDLVADHYFEPRWRGRPSFVLGSSSEAHKEAMDSIHRRAMHLTTMRLGPGFHWGEILTRVPFVFVEFRRFVAELTAHNELRGSWFDQALYVLDERQLGLLPTPP